MAYHYTLSGLDWVWLENGVSRVETPYGKGVTIEDQDGLHEAIIRTLITLPLPIRGQELRFIRDYLDMSQKELAAMLGVSRETIARREAERDRSVTATMTMAIRSYLALRLDDPVLTRQVEALVRRAEDARLQQLHFTDHDGGWAVAA